jgi:hypothetical protein
MSKTDAKRVSGCFEDLKNSITGMLKQGVAGGLQRRSELHVSQRP